jgi:hypothetical protein
MIEKEIICNPSTSSTLTTLCLLHAPMRIVPAPKRALKIGDRTLRTVSRLPAGGRNTFSPIPRELPVVLFRLQVIGYWV